MATATLEVVATHAHCSVCSLHAVFGGRDELVRAVFERYSPVLDIEEFLDRPRGDLSANWFDATDVLKDLWAGVNRCHR